MKNNCHKMPLIVGNKQVSPSEKFTNDDTLIRLSLLLQFAHKTTPLVAAVFSFFSLPPPPPHPLFSNRTDNISRKFLTRVLRKTVSAFPGFDFPRKAMEREWRVRGGQILSRGLTAGYGLKGVKCYYCKGYVCGREY